MGILVNRRRVMVVGSSLPYDAEVEWLQSDGNAYIDTGVKVANTTTFNITIKLLSTTSKEFWLFGARIALGNGQLTPYWKGTKWEWRYGSQVVSGGAFTLSTNTIYRISNVASSRVMKVTNSYSVTATANTFSTNNNFYLLGMNNNGTKVACYSDLVLVGGELYTSGTKAREYIPVRIGTVGYLYDKVSGTLFGNAGTGSFTIGPDKT
jgi:hypothetical protein